MFELFFQDYSNGKAYFTDTGRMKEPSKKSALRLNKALTFHPLKATEKMYSLHEYYVKLHLHRLKMQVSKIEISLKSNNI